MWATLRIVADNYWKFIVNDCTSSNNPLINLNGTKQLSKFVIKMLPAQEVNCNSLMVAGFPGF